MLFQDYFNEVSQGAQLLTNCLYLCTITKLQVGGIMKNETIDGWRGFINLCQSSKDAAALEQLFDLFLTPEEKENLNTRYLIVKELLQDDRTQREIAKALNVSIAKITRGSNELKRIDKKLLQYLKTNIYG